MNMIEAMQACPPNGYVARKARPGSRHYRSRDGIFYSAALVDQVDFMASDWEHHESGIKGGSPMKRWCIINLEWIDNGNFNASGISKLPERFAPTRFYEERILAENELFRLNRKYPSGKFYLFEAVGTIVPSMVKPGLVHFEKIS